MEMPSDAAFQLKRFAKVVDQLNALLPSLLASPALSPSGPSMLKAPGDGTADPAASTSDLDRARAHLLLAQAVHALAALLFKAKGVDTTKGALPTELDRLVQYQKKVRSQGLLPAELDRLVQ